VSTLDLAIRYGDDCSVDVAGSPSVLAALANVLRTDDPAEIAVVVPPGSPEPYQEWLDTIMVRPRVMSHLLVDRWQHQLVFIGDRKSLDILADSLDFLVSTPRVPGRHMHIEYFPDHHYLQKGSIPVVFSVE
jgi:hypothetical protein